MEVPKAATEKELKEVVLDIEKEYGVVEKIGTAFKEGTLIKSNVGKDIEISKDDVKTIQDEKDVLVEVSIAASDRGLEVVIDIEKEYGVSEAIGDATSMPSLIFSFQWKKAILIY